MASASAAATFPTIYSNPTDSTSFSFNSDTTTNYELLVSALSSRSPSTDIKNFIQSLIAGKNSILLSWLSILIDYVPGINGTRTIYCTLLSVVAPRQRVGS